LAVEAAGYIDQGFRRVKMRLARDPEYDRAAVIAVCKAIGANCDLIVDGSMRYSQEVARELGKFLAEQNVFWLEEPFAPENLDAFVQLRGTVGVRLAAGENEFGEQGFRELIRAGAVDIVQPDACRCGGISEMRKIADLARSAGLPIATHSWSDALAILANAHVVSAIDNGLTVEIDRTGNPFVDELLVEPLRVRDGQLTLSNKPGLGIELNRGVVDRYRIECNEIGEGLFSDMAFGKSYFTPAPPYGQGT